MPSFPALRMIDIDRRNVLSSSFCKSGVDCAFPFASLAARRCKSGGNSFIVVEWNENSWCSFTSNVKSSGVAAHQRSTIRGSGTE